MFDDLLRHLKDRLLTPVAARIGRRVHPNVVSVAALVVGLAVGVLAARRHYGAALACWAVKRALWQHWLPRLRVAPQLSVVDSVPVPVCRFARATQCRLAAEHWRPGPSSAPSRWRSTRGIVVGSHRIAELRPNLVLSWREDLQPGVEPWRSASTYGRGSPMTEQLAEYDRAAGEDDRY